MDRLASSLPGIGNSMPVGSELVSRTATIGIPNFFDSATARDSILVSIINIKSGVFFISDIPPSDLLSFSLSLPNFKISFLVKPKFSLEYRVKSDEDIDDLHFAQKFQDLDQVFTIFKKLGLKAENL